MVAQSPVESPTKPTAPKERYDVVVVGGGPAGTTFGRMMHERGFDTLIVERTDHPRFSIGESLLPGTMPVWRELGLVERFEQAGFLRKYGAYFCTEDGHAPEHFPFPAAGRLEEPHAYQVPRDRFDQILWDAAVEAGVACTSETSVERVTFDGDRATGVELGLPDGTRATVAARLVADCSGRTAVLGHQLGIRQRDRRLDKVALYRHYSDVVCSVGEDAGTIAIVGTPFGWMWLIPFAGRSASVGAVIDRAWYGAKRREGLNNEAVWDAVLTAVPAVARRLAHARPTRRVEAEADFQYRVDPIAGDGWVVIGDAGAFIDPVFSSGVHLAVTGARRASRAAAGALADGRLPAVRDFARYARRTNSSLGVFSKFIFAWYDPAFREVFMRPDRSKPGVALLEREIRAVLAGAEQPAWRAHLAIQILQWIAHISRSARPDEEPAVSASGD